MPPTKNSKTKWADAQFVLDDDGLPLPRGTRAIEILSKEQAGRKRGLSTESFLGGPEFCGPVEDRSGVAFTASDESRGGPAALRLWREARCQVDWVAVGEQHSGPQCDEPCIEPPEAPRRWWHGPNRDQGLEEISERAAAKEASQQASSTGLAGSWRREWPALWREQLRAAAKANAKALDFSIMPPKKREPQASARRLRLLLWRRACGGQGRGAWRAKHARALAA